MKRKSTGEYPSNWTEIALQVKQEAGWRCVRCKHPNDRETGHVLTVHHLDIDPSNCAWWNTPALCQKCHLSIQGRVVMERVWMLPHSDWFKPYVAGYYAHKLGLPEDKEYVLAHLEGLITQGVLGTVND